MLFLPPPVRIARVIWRMIPFVRRGLRCLLRGRIQVELLDALSISISACQRDFGTADAVMFLLEIGELLEEWTRKKSVEDLARCMSLNVDRVWLRTPQGEVLVPIAQIQPGDAVVVRAGRCHSYGWRCAGGRGNGQSGIPHRRISPGGPSGQEVLSMLALWWKRENVFLRFDRLPARVGMIRLSI